jgi:hypothetical protein
MRETVIAVAATASALLILCVGGIYCTKIVRGKAHPAIVTWIIFEIGVLMSLATYLTSHSHSLVRSITNTTDVVGVSAILITLFVKRWGEKLSFSKDERLCFKVIAAAFAAWALSRNPWIANASFQVVMVVAYWPTFKKLWHWPECSPGTTSPEPFVTWSANTVAGLLGFCVALAGRDGLASLYPLRATILCATVLVLIKRIDRRNHLSAAF